MLRHSLADGRIIRKRNFQIRCCLAGKKYFLRLLTYFFLYSILVYFICSECIEIPLVLLSSASNPLKIYLLKLRKCFWGRWQRWQFDRDVYCYKYRIQLVLLIGPPEPHRNVHTIFQEPCPVQNDAQRWLKMKWEVSFGWKHKVVFFGLFLSVWSVQWYLTVTWLQQFCYYIVWKCRLENTGTFDVLLTGTHPIRVLRALGGYEYLLHVCICAFRQQHTLQMKVF